LSETLRGSGGLEILSWFQTPLAPTIAAVRIPATNTRRVSRLLIRDHPSNPSKLL
jgi:hypothetical protein